MIRAYPFHDIKNMQKCAKRNHPTFIDVEPMARTSVTSNSRKNVQNSRNLGSIFEILRFLGFFPVSTDGKFSAFRWYRLVAITILLMVFILPVEIYDYVRLLPKRKKYPYKMFQSTMSVAHKFSGFFILVFHVRATRKFNRELVTVYKYLIKYQYHRVDLLAYLVVIWTFTNHLIFTYHRTSLANFEDFARIANYIRSRLIFVLFLLSHTSLTHVYSALLHYLIQRFKKSMDDVKKTPSSAILQHSRLLELTNSIHLSFSVQMLLLFVDCTYTLIINTYFISTLFVNNERDMNFDKISERVFSFGSLLYYSMFSTNRCEKLNKVAEAFNNELFKLMRDSKDLCSNSKLRLYVTMKQTVNFTACGFFSLGYPLVTSIIAAATTYLVILIQFSLITN